MKSGSPYLWWIVALFTVVLQSCGDNVKFRPGPVLSGMIDKQREAEASVSRWEILSKNVDRCGDEPSSESANQKTEQPLVVSPFTVKIEELRDGDHPRTAVAFEGKRFNFKVAQKSLGATTELLAASRMRGSESGETLDLVPKLNEIEKPPIVIRVNCFELDEHDVLNTDGRDLFIVADKFVINGTIRTTPAARDDYPGGNGGDLTILAIKGRFGPKSLLNVSGGDAGVITSYPGIIIDDSVTSENIANKNRIIQELRSELLYIEDPQSRGRGIKTITVSDSRIPDPENPEEISQLVEAYENVRKTFLTSDVQGAERMIFDMAMNYIGDHGGNVEGLDYARVKVLKDAFLWTGLMDSERKTKLEADDGRVWRLVWKFAIRRRLEEENLRSIQGYAAGAYEMPWIADGKLGVIIHDLSRKDTFKKDMSGRTIYFRESATFDRLSGGNPGAIKLVVGEMSDLIKKDDRIGRSTIDKPHPIWKYLVDGQEKYLSLGLIARIQRTFQFVSRKNMDDKVVVPDEYVIHLEKNIDGLDSALRYEIKENLSSLHYKLHPNIQKTTLKDLKLPLIKINESVLLEDFEKSGLAVFMPHFEELKLAKEKK